MKKILLLLLFTLLLTACAQPTANDTPALRVIRLPMGYIPDPQYAPYYVAADKGYFAAEGLAVEFDYSFETDGMALVGANALPFAVVSGEQVILARAQNVPVVYVFQWFQRYPTVVVSLSSANIRTPADLVGRKVGLPGFFGTSYVGFVGLLSANGLREADVNANDIGFNQVESLLAGQSEAVVGYAGNEPVQLAARGYEVNVIYAADYIDMVANGIITNETVIAQEPELVEGFVRALRRGLADTLANPAEAYEISKKFVEGLDDSRMNVLEASLELWRADQLGLTDPAAWAQTEQVLLQMGLLDAPLADLAAIYTNEFVLKAERSD